MDRNGAVFLHLSTVFPGIRAVKLKESMYVKPHIRELLEDTDFEELRNIKDLRAWEALQSVVASLITK